MADKHIFTSLHSNISYVTQPFPLLTSIVIYFLKSSQEAEQQGKRHSSEERTFYPSFNVSMLCVHGLHLCKVFDMMGRGRVMMQLSGERMRRCLSGIYSLILCRLFSFIMSRCDHFNKLPCMSVFHHITFPKGD